MLKKTIILVIFSCMAMVTNGQVLLGSEGPLFKSAPNAKYIVLEYDGYSAAELYTTVIKALNNSGHIPKKVIPVVQNEMIAMRGKSDIGIGKVGYGYSYHYDYYYNLTVHFKDGRIRIDLPIIEFPFPARNEPDRKLYLSGNRRWVEDFIFRDNGKIIEFDAKQKIEDDMNNIISIIVSSIITINEDW